MKKLLDLFLSFFKIGLFTFGGGYAMISIIENTCVEKKKWITHDDMMNVTVIAESTPGPIAINCATFVGYKHAKLPGSIAATLGVVLPSFIIIYIISMFLDNFLEIKIIANAFNGIKIAVAILITRVGLNLVSKISKQIVPRIIFAVSFAVMLLIDIFALSFSSIWLLIPAGFIGFLAFIIQEKLANKEDAAR